MITNMDYLYICTEKEMVGTIWLKRFLSQKNFLSVSENHTSTDHAPRLIKDEDDLKSKIHWHMTVKKDKINFKYIFQSYSILLNLQEKYLERTCRNLWKKNLTNVSILSILNLILRNIPEKVCLLLLQLSKLIDSMNYQFVCFDKNTWLIIKNGVYPYFHAACYETPTEKELTPKKISVAVTINMHRIFEIFFG